jgi:hypothetical protein
MQTFVALGLGSLGLAALLLALLSIARFVADWREARATRIEAQKLGPFRDATSRPLRVPSLGGPSYLLAAMVALVLLVLVADRRVLHAEAEPPQHRGDEDGSDRLLVGDPSLRALGHVVRMSGNVTGLGFDQAGDVIVVSVQGARALDPIALLGRVDADIDRARVEELPDHTELVIHLVPGRRPRWSVEAINDCLVLRFARAGS